MKLLRAISVIYGKDLRLELRTRITVTSVILFSFLVLLIFNFSLPNVSLNSKVYAPGILWITFAFAGVLALQRIFDHERDRWGMRGMTTSPADRVAIYFAKLILHLTIMFFVELVSLAVYTVLFNPSWSTAVFAKIIFVSFLATVGFSALGVLVSSMLYNEKLKELLLPLIFYPLVVPLVIIAVKSTGGIVNDGGLTLIPLIIGFDGVFLALGLMLYDAVIEGS